MPPERLLSWLALHLLPGVGPIALRRALDRFGDPAEIAFRLPASAWRAIEGVGAAAAEIVAARPGLERRAEAEAGEAERRNVRIVSLDDPDYPALIAALPDPPVVLYLKGALPPGRARIAIVGSRRATAYGREVARELADELARRGAEIVSGGARGIDTCAHEGALAAGGRTVAVLGSGFGHVYPPENANLFDAIAASGALVSEFPIAMSPLAGNFPRRNRLISALAAAVVVVEATEKSGSLHTAAHALDQGREVMAVPGPVTSPQSAGCHRLILAGAKLVRRADDVVEELSPMYRDALVAAPEASAGHPEAPPLLPDETAVLALFDDPRPVHVDALADAAPFGIARLQAALFALVLRGAIEPLPGGHYVVRGRASP